MHARRDELYWAYINGQYRRKTIVFLFFSLDQTKK